MNPSSLNAEKMKAFKASFTPESVKQFYGNYAKAIAFHEIELTKLRTMRKDFEKRFERKTFFDQSVVKSVADNEDMLSALKKTEIAVQHEFNNQIELLEAKIAHLKSIK